MIKRLHVVRISVKIFIIFTRNSSRLSDEGSGENPIPNLVAFQEKETLNTRTMGMRRSEHLEIKRKILYSNIIMQDFIKINLYIHATLVQS